MTIDQLKVFYTTVRARTEELSAPLSEEDSVVQPVFYASPTKWHLGHTTWFFEQMILKQYSIGYNEFDSEFGYLFNSYYNTIGDRVLRAERGNLTRPSLKRVYEYRSFVDEQMEKLFDAEITIGVMNLIELGLNHEQQHQELLLTDIKYVLGHNPTFPKYHESLIQSNQQNEENGFVKIEEGVYKVGFQGDGFSYDNEHGVHKTYIQSFEISKSLVTNGEYIEFIESNGYQTFYNWLDEGWTWINENEITSPLYWFKKNNEWYRYTLTGFEKINPNDILTHISFYEANAYAAWKGFRIPTEFEWEVACDQFNWGSRWEWTNSAYLPYPGFEIADGAVGEYNGKFMINQMVLRGSSVATAKEHSRKTYRNFFHPHFQWQFTGIRLAR